MKVVGCWCRYRTYWLAGISKSDAGRPTSGFLPDHTCHFSLPWGQVVAPYRDPTHTLGVEVLTDLSTVRLYQDGVLVGNASINSTALGWASIRWNPAGQNLTAVCQSDDASTTLRHTMLRPGQASAILLTVDAPSEKTGTGAKLLLDGHDVALLRATIVDDRGATVVSSSANVSFSIVSGPGRVIGTHNGDDACHEPDVAPWHSAFGGLVRAIVQVTEHTDARLRDIDRDVAHVRLVDPSDGVNDRSIQIVASSDGLTSGHVTIDVSTDERHSVLAVAAKAAHE